MGSNSHSNPWVIVSVVIAIFLHTLQLLRFRKSEFKVLSYAWPVFLLPNIALLIVYFVAPLDPFSFSAIEQVLQAISYLEVLLLDYGFWVWPIVIGLRKQCELSTRLGKLGHSGYIIVFGFVLHLAFVTFGFVYKLYFNREVPWASSILLQSTFIGLVISARNRLKVQHDEASTSANIAISENDGKAHKKRMQQLHGWIMVFSCIAIACIVILVLGSIQGKTYFGPSYILTASETIAGVCWQWKKEHREEGRSKSIRKYSSATSLVAGQVPSYAGV